MLPHSPVFDRAVTGNLCVILDVGGGLSPEGRPAESVGSVALRQRSFVARRSSVGRVLLRQFVVGPRDCRRLLRSGSTGKGEARPTRAGVQHWLLIAGH